MKNAFLFLALFLVICGVACGADLVKEPDLKIGNTPTPPKLKQPGEKGRQLLMQENMPQQKPLLQNAPQNSPQNTAQNAPQNAPTDPKASNILTIMSSSGGLLTLWALAENNWVWGYAPLDAYDFGNAAKWRILSYKNGQVQIKNEKQNTCLTGYKNGVVHLKCDVENPAQLWIINFFDNQAVQLKNVGKNACLQTPTERITSYYSIYLTGCATSKQENLDQQWYILPDNTLTFPVFTK